MSAFQKVLDELGGFDDVRRALKKEGTVIHLTGGTEESKLHTVSGLCEGYRCTLIVTYSDLKAKEIVENYRFYDRDVQYYPAKDLIFYQADIHGNELTVDRIRCLKKIFGKERTTIVTTFDALMVPQLPYGVYEKNTIRIGKDSVIDEKALAIRLTDMGYERVFQVERPGEFSIRGGIIDIFDLTSENPCRIELWGDEIESMRYFDVLSQRSVEKIDEFTVGPATEMLLTGEELRAGMEKIEKEAALQEKKLRERSLIEEAHRVSVMCRELKEQVMEYRNLLNLDGYVNYFYDNTILFPELFKTGETVVFLDEPMRIDEHAKAVEAEFRESMEHRLEKGYILPGQAKILSSEEQAAAVLSRCRIVHLSNLEIRNRLTGNLLKPDHKLDISAKSVPSYNNSFETLVKDLERLKKQGYRVMLLSGSRTRAKRLSEDLRDYDLNAFYTEDPEREVKPREIAVMYAKIRRGFEYPLIKFAVISETDIFGAEKKKKRHKKLYDGQKIRDFNELRVGDYVVHESHGLGIYRGIEQIEVDKVTKDYIKIEYRDGGNLYVLATGLSVLQKYAGSDAKKPKLNRLGSKEWANTKAKVRTATMEIAKDLVELYAKRQSTSGYRFSRDTVWQKEFEELFPFEETEDQLSAIEATKADMESGKVMDRLICGDVGYGKTEIAIRAAFKAVQDGKQVVYLVPTTILAQQHYNTFIQRMNGFPVRVELLSRFRSAAEIRKVLIDLKKGFVDIVIGTHRVLSKDVEYKDLGLLIIDEEQRFGVAHKEKIKKLKNNVDVLTLTATPIPRTLHMSLVGIRDMSILDEPPEDRQPIQTYVMEYNEELVREAIVRELSRNGQVYYVYNRVNSIADVAARIRDLVPEAQVAFAHGQMAEKELEQIMYDFINGEIDVLVSTTIIETGLDISNVNTMIIHDSDRLGLSQLYQLRGRVGRSSRTAYAFLMYKRDKLLKEEAEKRLGAIREFTELGSGYKIAMKDLEIRGAGNLLGKTQHGHMQAVGYDLYCRMLNDAVKNLKGIETGEDFLTTVDLDVDAFIPEEYIVNEVQKLDIYKRIAGIETDGEYEDMREELLDRFGVIPESAENLLRIAMIRVRAHRLFMNEVKGKDGRIAFSIRPDAKIDPSGIPRAIAAIENLRFDTKELRFTCTYHKCGMVQKDERMLLKLTEDITEVLLRELL
ncbi:MAG: transcription-repair coupling factor [Lachnospiraceae bacterium]|nr:transcription-repair coupling factor [Lachnospiraceae bacterium]